MNMTRRGGADDTGEQDVRELRRLFGGSADDAPTRSFPDSVPYVRHKEDVPHEDALPDFYGLDKSSEEDDEVTDELLQMVEDGELCFGWLEDRQEFGFWFPDEEPAGRLLVMPDAPPEPVSATRGRPRRPFIKRALLALAATVAAPFAIGVCSYAAEEGEHHAHHPVDQPDLAAENDGYVSNGDVHAMSSHPETPVNRPVTTTSYMRPTAIRAKHAKPSVKPEVASTAAPAGKHRKAPVLLVPSAAPSSTATLTVKLPVVTPSPSATALHHPGSVSTLVHGVLGPVTSLIGR